MMAFHPLSAVPQLESLPGAAKTLYLDFNGQSLPDRWTTLTNGNELYPGTTPAYDTNGNAASFSDQELAEIRRMWAFVAERFSPFNVNVSTKPAPHYLNLQNGKDFVVVVGGTGHWYNSKKDGGPALGVAMKGSFYNNYFNVGFVFSKNSGFDSTDQLEMAHAIAHEAGHGYGLEHQADWSGNTLVNEYGQGNASASPIMGNNTQPGRVTWWNGPTDDGPSDLQNDAQFLGSMLGYRADDFGNTTGSASSLLSVGQGLLSRRGVIERRTDQDAFKFTSGNATRFSVRVTRPAEKGMLDADLLVSRGGSLVGSAVSSAADEILVLNNQPRFSSFGVIVKSHGGHGDLGQYQVDVLAANIVGASSAYRGFGASFAVQDFGPTADYRWDLDGDGVFGETGAAAARGSEVGRGVTMTTAGMNRGAYAIKVRVSRPDGMSSDAQTTLQVKTPRITITEIDPNAGEGYAMGAGGQYLSGGTIRISRDGPTALPLEVTVNATGTAVKGIDYTADKISVYNKVTIPATRSYIDIPISVINDLTHEGPEYALFTLAPGGQLYELGTATAAGVVIKDDDLISPTQLRAAGVQKTRVDLQWNDNSYNETRWILQVSRVANFSSGVTEFTVAGANKTSTAVTGLLANTTYHFRLKAANDEGASQWSATLAVTTLA